MSQAAYKRRGPVALEFGIRFSFEENPSADVCLSLSICLEIIILERGLSLEGQRLNLESG